MNELYKCRNCVYCVAKEYSDGYKLFYCTANPPQYLSNMIEDPTQPRSWYHPAVFPDYNACRFFTLKNMCETTNHYEVKRGREES